MLNQKNMKYDRFAINASLGQYTDTDTVNDYMINGSALNQPNYVVQEFGTYFDSTKSSDVGGVLNIGAPSYIEMVHDEIFGGSIKTFKSTIVASDTDFSFEYGQDDAPIDTFALNEIPINGGSDDGTTYSMTFIHNSTQGAAQAYTIPNDIMPIENIVSHAIATGATLECGTVVESVCTGILGVRLPLNYINMFDINETPINDGVITEPERYVKIHAHPYMHVCPTLRIASCTQIENHVDWFLPVIRRLIFWSDPTAVADMWSTDAIDFGAIRMRSKVAVISTQLIRHWSNPEIHPVVEVMSDCVINPVIYKHGTMIFVKPQMYSDAEVIGRWLYAESNVEVESVGLVKKGGYIEASTSVSWHSFAEIIERFIYMFLSSTMEGGHGIRTMNPTPKMELSVQQHSGANIKGKITATMTQNVQVKGSSVLYVDGGVKVSEHDDCPVFI